MSAPIVVVLPLGKGSLDIPISTAEVLWAAMPRERRLALDYGNNLSHLATIAESRDPWGDTAADGRTDLDGNRVQMIIEHVRHGNCRLVRSDSPAAGDDTLARLVAKQGIAVLIITRWLLHIPDPLPEGRADDWGSAERSLLDFLVTTDCRVIGFSMDSGLHQDDLESSMRRLLGDRLWILRQEHPSHRDDQQRSSRRDRGALIAQETTIPRSLGLQEYLPDWVGSIAKAHARLPWTDWHD